MRKRSTIGIALAGAVVMFVGLLQTVAGGAGPDPSNDASVGPGTVVQTNQANQGPGRMVNGASNTAAPSAADISQAEEAARGRPNPGPARGAGVVAADLAQGQTGPTSTSSAEPTGLSIFRNTTIPSSGLSGGYANVSFKTGEPSTDGNGKNIFQTGNWYATYSKDGGTTWTSLNPFTIFGSGFCCDQVVIYDSARDRWFWVLQYADHLTVANSAGGDMVNWCSYNFTPAAIGAKGSFDYNDLALGTRFLYLASNTDSGSSVLRLPMSEMVTCSGFSYNFILRSTEFTYKVATGAGDTALIASNNLDSGTGTTLRILSWPENTSAITVANRTISAFTYYTRNSGQDCTSADAAVNNWCQYADSRVLGGAKGGNLVAWTWNAKQNGTSRPKPYTRLTILDARTLTVLNNYDVFNASLAIQYMSIGLDDRGHIGMVATVGGGTGTSHTYPSPMVFIRDDVNPAPGFSGVTVATGLGGGCSDGGLIRWGDYQTARALESADGVFIGAGLRHTTTSGTGGSVNPPRNFVFGRARSLPGYNRWKNS